MRFNLQFRKLSISNPFTIIYDVTIFHRTMKIHLSKRSNQRCSLVFLTVMLILLVSLTSVYTSGKYFIKITSVGMGAAKSNETRYIGMKCR